MVTEFTDHICVTMDAELIMFLHDLVSAYLKEKEKGFFGSASVRSFVRSFGAASSAVNKTTGRGARAWQRSLCAGGHFSGVRGTVISTLSGEVTAPNTLGMLMAFLLSESNKLTVSAEAAGHPP